MAKDIASMSNPPSFCSVIQVDKDISFVLDNRDINFDTDVPTDNISISQKTYSKKFPLICGSSVFVPDNKVNGNGNITARYKRSILKTTPKCSSTSPQNAGKEVRKKRPLSAESSKGPVAKKMRKRETAGAKLPPSQINGQIMDNTKYPKSLPPIRVPSPDSDCEILDVIVRGSSSLMKIESVDAFYGKERNKLSNIQKKRNSKSLSTVLKPCYPSTDDVPITEADIAPIIPSNSVIPDTSISETNQEIFNSRPTNRWRMISTVTSMQKVSSVKMREASGAKESVRLSDRSNLSDSEMKISPGKHAVKRELKSLYENLNEIYWAKEKRFQHLLSTDQRHSERITAKATDAGKNLRRLKAQSGNALSLSPRTRKKALAKRNTSKLALNKAKFGLPEPKTIVKKEPKAKPSINKESKKVIAKPVVKPNRKVKMTDKKVKSQASVNVKDKPEPEIKNEKNSPPSKKVGVSKYNGKTEVGYNAGRSSFSALRKIKTEKDCQVLPNSSSSSKIVKKVEYSSDINFTTKKYSDNNAYSSAVKKGSKLRVEVEPLEHTSLWNNSFCEAFSKYVIEQSSTQLESKNRESTYVKAMFEELMDSWFHSPPDSEKVPKKKKPFELTFRSSVRQSECAFRYKEIVVKKHDNYMQFVLVPNAVKQNSLSIEAMKELKDAFLLAKKDPNCRAVLLNSSGTFFCTGIDLSLLIGTNKKQAAEEMALTIKDLVLTLSSFTKPVVAAVNGIAVGFGVTLLTLCDVVLASDKATFCIPATRLGYLPEGAITLTLPQVVGSTVATELLLYGRRLTADQALRHGLVSEVLWHSNLMNEVVPRVQIIVSQPLQVMEATKTMVRCQLWDKLKLHMEREWRLLPPLWLDAQCQNNIKKALQTGWLFD